MMIIVPCSITAGGLLFGIIFQAFIHSRLSLLAKKTKWKGDDIIIRSLRGTVVLWFLLSGLYFGIRFSYLPQKIQIPLQKALIAGVIFTTTWMMAKIISEFILLYGSKLEGRLPSLTLFSNFFKIFTIIIGGLVIFQTLGIAITPVITALGVGGLAVALALQDTLANLFAGFHVAVSGQVRPGDFVKLDSGEEGFVEDISWRNTTIRKIRNNMVVIPNSKLAGSVITNYNLPKREMTVLVAVGVSYASNLERVEEVTKDVGREVMQSVPGGVPEFEPVIRFHTFNDFSIDMNVILRCKEYTNQYLLKHEFIKRLHARYNKEGIEIPFPVRTVQMQKAT